MGIPYDSICSENALVKLEAISPQFAAFCGKLDGLFARLALIFHCCESVDLKSALEATNIPARISEDTTHRVDRLLRKFIVPHALHFYLDLGGETTVMADARSIAGYILAHKVERLTFGALTTNCRPCHGRARDEVRRMLEPLEMFGWLKPDNPVVPRAWSVQPQVHEIFARKAIAKTAPPVARSRDMERNRVGLGSIPAR